MADISHVIRGVLIQVAGARLLLPNAAIAEVLSYAPPDPIDGAPDWLLGRIRWRGWALPLITFSRFSGIAEEQGGLGSKVIVLKALGGDTKHPYFAVLTQGFPRLVTVTDAAMTRLDAGEEMPDGVMSRVRLNEDEALVPDLEDLETSLREALDLVA